MEDLVRRKNELQEPGKKKKGKVPGIVLKGLFLAVAVGVVPLLQKQSPQLKGMVMGYASHAAIARSWELINLLVIALAISYGFISRSRHTDNATATATANATDDDAREQGAQNYVQKIFDFAEVFDNLDKEKEKEKAEAWSSRWQPQEPVVVIARDGSGTDHDKDKPLLLPIRSLKSSLSNAELLDFLKDKGAAVEEMSGIAAEVRNGTILSVESGNFEEEVSTVVADEEPAVFPSPIPWALRLDKEPHPLVPAVVNLASDDGKIDPPAIPSPIPWRSRPGPDRSVLSDHDGKKELGTENGDVSDSKPPLPPPQRPPPPPPEMPKKSASPSPSLGSANGNSQKNMQVPSGIPLQKFPSPSPSPSPSPPRPPPSVELTDDISEKNLQASSGTPLHKLPSHAAFVENGSSQKNPNPKPQYSNAGAAAQAEEKDPTASAPSFPTVAENGSSVKHHSNGNFSIPKSPQSAVATVPPPALERSGNAPASRSKSGDDGSYLRGKGRECSSRSNRRRSKIRESSAVAETEAEEGARARRSSRKLELASPISDVPLTPSPLDPDDSPPLPLPPPPPYSDGELSYETTSSSSDLLYQMDDSFSETETEGEVDKKADQFIAKFHEQIRMQRVESMRRSQEER